MKHSLILLHGALGTSDQLIPLRQALSDSYDVYDLNFEGHGGVPSSLEFTMDRFAANVLQVIRDHKLIRPHLFGYSMGGYVALQLARRYPDQLGKIMTLATKIDWNPDFAAGEIKKLNPDKIEEKVPAFAQHLSRQHGPEYWKEVVRKTARMMSELSEDKKLTNEDLHAIEKEVLITVGDQDQMVSVEESILAAQHIRQGKFKLLPGVPHPIEKVDMQLLEGEIKDFFN